MPRVRQHEYRIYCSACSVPSKLRVKNLILEEHLITLSEPPNKRTMLLWPVLVCLLALAQIAAVFAGSTGQSVNHHLVSADREGSLTLLTPAGMDYHCSLAVSPDDRYLVVEVGPRRDGDLWILELESRRLEQLTYDEAGAYDPLFAPDGRFVYFSSNRDDAWGLFRKRTDGSGEEERVTRSDRLQIASSISSDSRLLAYFQRQDDVDWDIWILPLESGRPAWELFDSSYAAVAPVFSPDGRRIAYFSDESGDLQIYVQSLADPADKIRVTPDGSEVPWGEMSEVRWSRDGLRLFSVSPDATIWEAAVSSRAGAMEPGRPQPLFQVPAESLFRVTQGCGTVNHDGQRFYFIRK